uniref:Uncharacterized protein LOC105035521 n=1 Tax=Elaeis guineensis var. tenera TaxID=51953 RepID=A0A8N4EUU0_ELAGV
MKPPTKNNENDDHPSSVRNDLGPKNSIEIKNIANDGVERKTKTCLEGLLIQDRSLPSFSNNHLKLQHMKPAHIDWENIKSKYVRDIKAPKWINLAAPDASSVDDEAWFCCPDCRHPKTEEDFQRWTPSPKFAFFLVFEFFREANNLKRRGIMAFLPSSPLCESLKTKAAASKMLRDDLENQNPNLSTPPPPSRSLGAPKMTKIAKELIKPRTEKNVEEEREQWQQQKNCKPQLKSTLSVRNLFSGKDILSQISEFCQELKKLAVRSVRPAAQEETKEEEGNKIPETTPEEVGKRELGKRDLDSNSKRDDGSGKKSGKIAMKVEVEEKKYKKGLYENSSIQREVRACPPTKRIPSPSSRPLRKPKATATTCYPLNKSSRSTAL